MDGIIAHSAQFFDYWTVWLIGRYSRYSVWCDWGMNLNGKGKPLSYTCIPLSNIQFRNSHFTELFTIVALKEAADTYYPFTFGRPFIKILIFCKHKLVLVGAIMFHFSIFCKWMRSVHVTIRESGIFQVSTPRSLDLQIATKSTIFHPLFPLSQPIIKIFKNAFVSEIPILKGIDQSLFY